VFEVQRDYKKKKTKNAKITSSYITKIATSTLQSKKETKGINITTLCHPKSINKETTTNPTTYCKYLLTF